jgi:hypothetical protein
LAVEVNWTSGWHLRKNGLIMFFKKATPVLSGDVFANEEKERRPVRRERFGDSCKHVSS